MTKHAEIAARLAAATPGPWVQGEMPEWEDYRIVSESVREEWRATAEEGDDWEPPHKVIITADECSDGDFDLILHAPTDIAFLLNEIIRLEAETDRKQAGWDACTAGLEELDRRLAAAEAEVATLREALERITNVPGNRGDYAIEIARSSLATPTATAREGEPSDG